MTPFDGKLEPEVSAQQSAKLKRLTKAHESLFSSDGLRTAKGKPAAVLSGLIALFILGAGMVFWEEGLSWYYLWRLRRDPRNLEEIVLSPETSPQGHAVRVFVASEPGRRTLLEVFLKKFPQYLEERIETYVKNSHKDHPLLLWLYSPGRYQSVGHYCRSVGSGTMSVNVEIRELQPLLWFAGYRDYPLPGREYLSFSTLSWDDDRVTSLDLQVEHFGSGLFVIEW